MAEDWIKMRTDLYRDPKVCIIANLIANGELKERLSEDNRGDYVYVGSNVLRNATVGALVSLWGVMRHRGERVGDDLVCYGAAIAVVDDIADLPGFGLAMEVVGWVEEEDDGIRFPRFFSTHNADPGEHRDLKREQNRARQQRFRDKKKGNAKNNAVTPLEKRRVEESREETIHPEEQDKDKEGKDPEPEIGSDGWMEGKSATDMLKRVGVNGNNLKVLGSHKDITQGAVRTACRGLASEKVRSRPAVLVQRLVDEFDIKLGKRSDLEPGAQKLAKTLETQRRKR